MGTLVGVPLESIPSLVLAGNRPLSHKTGPRFRIRAPKKPWGGGSYYIVAMISINRRISRHDTAN